MLNVSPIERFCLLRGSTTQQPRNKDYYSVQYDDGDYWDRVPKKWITKAVNETDCMLTTHAKVP